MLAAPVWGATLSTSARPTLMRLGLPNAPTYLYSQHSLSTFDRDTSSFGVDGTAALAAGCAAGVSSMPISRRANCIFEWAALLAAASSAARRSSTDGPRTRPFAAADGECII